MPSTHYGEFPVTEARIDYLTCSIGPGYKQAILASRAAEWQLRRQQEGYQVREFRWSGYDGETVDGITWGTREDGAMLRMSGEVAHRHALTALTFASNVSRIDAEVTIQCPSSSVNFAEHAHDACRVDARVASGMTKTSIIRSTPRGTTAYIGSRSSDRYFRVYDKTAESDGAYPQWSWRYEVEYKKDRAWRVAQHLLKAKGSPESIRQVVEQAFFDYSVVLPCLALPPGWRDKGTRQETNDERRLAWLNRSIRPMIEKLSEGCSRATILEALGLEGLMDVDTGEVFAKTTTDEDRDNQLDVDDNVLRESWAVRPLA